MTRLIFLCLLATACTGTAPEADSVVRDSSGVRVVETTLPDQLPVWTLSADPITRIGGINDPAFGLAGGAVRFEGGTVVVADILARQVRIFDASGELIAEAGRPGGGPGEFENIRAMWRADGDSVAIYDSRLQRYTVVAVDGGIGRTTLLIPTGERVIPAPVGWLADGRLVSVNDPRAMVEDVRYRPTVAVVAYAPDGTAADTLALVSGTEMWNWEWEMGVTPSHVPFGLTTTVRTWGNDVFVAGNDGFQVDRHDATGALTARYRILLEPAPLSADIVAGYVDAEKAKATSGADSKGGNELFGRMAEAAPYPDFLPWYDDLLIDDGGMLWLRKPASETAEATVLVMSPAGEVVTSVVLPPQFIPTDVTHDHVTGIARDELDVETVLVFRLQR